MTHPRSGRSLRITLAVALALAPLVASAPALAEPTAEDRAAARALFDEGRALMAKEAWAEACPKLEESQRIDPGMGVQFNLADCQEHVGKLASAWANFLDVASKAKAAGQEPREKVARDRASLLAPRLSKLVVVANDPAGTLVVKRDGLLINKALWGTAMPLDQGDHLLSAVAPGKKPWQTTVTLKGEASSLTITIPALVDLPPEVRVAPALAPVTRAVPQDRGLGGRRIAALSVGGVGLAGVVVGTAFGIVAKSKYDASLDHCPDPNKPNACVLAGKTLRDEAITAGNVSTAAFVIGGAAVVGGIVLWVTAPSRREAKPKGAFVQLSPGPGQAGIGLTGGF